METQKVIALVFVFLMVGSLVTVFFGMPDDSPEVNVPEQRILNYELSKEQRKVLLSRGYTLIEFSYPSTCFECENQKVKLEDITQRVDGQVYLQELSGGTDSSLTITSLKGQKIIAYTTDEKVQDTICDMVLNPPVWCISLKV